MRVENTPIFLDRFTSRPAPGQKFTYLLSHLHADHTIGLTSSWDAGTILCSDITRDLLMLKFAPSNPRLIRALAVGETTLIYLDAQKTVPISVTLVNANHCPGSVMFLLDGYFGRVLCTGDFRYDSVSEDVHFPLFDKLRNGAPVTLALVDNTYCQPHNEFASRAQTSEWLLQTLLAYPADAHFFIGIDTLGKEELLIKLAIGLNTRVVVTPARYAALCLLGVSNFFTCQLQGGRVEVTSRRMITEQYGRNHWGPCGVGVLASAFYIAPLSVAQNRSSCSNSTDAWDNMADDHRVMSTGSAGKEREWCMYRLNSDRAVGNLIERATEAGAMVFHNLPRLLHVPYSLHSSQKELRSFIGRVRPQKTVPSSVTSDVGMRNLSDLVNRVLCNGSDISNRNSSNHTSAMAMPVLPRFPRPQPNFSTSTGSNVPNTLGWQEKTAKAKRRSVATSSSSTYANGENAQAIVAGVGVRADCFNRHPANARRAVRRSGKRRLEIGDGNENASGRSFSCSSSSNREHTFVLACSTSAPSHLPTSKNDILTEQCSRSPKCFDLSSNNHDHSTSHSETFKCIKNRRTSRALTRNERRAITAAPQISRAEARHPRSIRGDDVAAHVHQRTGGNKLECDSTSVPVRSSRSRESTESSSVTEYTAPGNWDTGGAAASSVVTPQRKHTVPRFSHADDKILRSWSKLKRKIADTMSQRESGEFAQLIKRAEAMRALLDEYSDGALDQRMHELNKGNRRAGVPAVAVLQVIVK